MEQATLTVYFDDPFRAGLFGLHGETGCSGCTAKRAFRLQGHSRLFIGSERK